MKNSMKNSSGITHPITSAATSKIPVVFYITLSPSVELALPIDQMVDPGITLGILS